MDNRELWNTIVGWKDGEELPKSQWIDTMNAKHNMPIHFVGAVGVEHYRLLSRIVKLLPGENVVDIGTYEGCSALAMAAEPSTTVISYDIMNRIHRLPKESNIDYRVVNLLRTKVIPETRFIMLDVDPHDGIQEPMFMKLFDAVRYKGIVMLDDIHLNPPMQRWWDSIKREKVDLVGLGHHSGTGMVYFD